MTSTKYSISAAHRITGKSRTTITAHMNSGKLSYTEDDEGNKVIDASELMRVYGDYCDFSKESSDRKQSIQEPEKEKKQESGSIELKYLKAQLENEQKERERERGLLKTQIENLQESLKTSQEGHNRATLLLENHTDGAGEWEKSLKALESRIANQEATAKEEKERADKVLRQNRALKKALDEEKNKSFFKKLFG